jgi:hypothetical protein
MVALRPNPLVNLTRYGRLPRTLAIMKTITTASIMFWLFAMPVAADDQPLSPDLLGAMRALTQILTDGYADMYPDSAKYVDFQDLPWRGSSSGAIVLFYVGGWGLGNTNTQLLAVFSRNKKLYPDGPTPDPYRLVGFATVGEKGARAIGSVSIEGSSIVLTGTEAGAHDPMCCLSSDVTLRHTVKDRNLVLEAHDD